jgi:hypothetical protein
MWRAAAIFPLVLVAASCGGGGGKPLAETARPCLTKLGDYVHHKREKGLPSDPDPRLPLLDPDAAPTASVAASRLKWPDNFQEYGEVLYPPSNPGANAVQIFIFGDEELPMRILAAIRRATRNQTFFLAAPGTTMNRIGQSIVQWSSRPSAKQRTTVRACLTRA